MRTIIYGVLSLIFSSLVLIACKDDFDIEKLQDTSRLVVYSFPTEGDTTLVVVARSLPVATSKGYVEGLSRKPIDAHVVYKVNGIEQSVKCIQSKQEAKAFSKTRDEDGLSRLVGQYYVVGKQKAGDEITIQVSAPGFPDVIASTYIPQKIDVAIANVKMGLKASDGYSMVDRIEATFRDEASSHDFYSVKVRQIRKEGMAVGIRQWETGEQDTVYVYNYGDFQACSNEYVWNFDSLAWETTDLMLLTEDEPILNKRSKLDDDFGMDYYEYFDNAYVFNDRMINGQSYTLHLDLLSHSYYNYNGWDDLYGYTYAVDLYKVTPEYYRFLKSVNDAQSNSWADVGLMQVTPTYSNVKGGFGVVAGYHVSESAKFIAPLPSDNQGGIYTK